MNTQVIPKSRNKARIEILNFIMNFCVHKCFGPGSYSIPQSDWAFHGSCLDDQTPPIGSLCIINSAGFSKFYMGWLLEVKKGTSRFDEQYLIESIEDGALCWWSNISIWHLPLSTTDKHPDWKWTDEQFDFKDRWMKACRRRDAFITLPVYPVFKEDGGVILATRERYGLSAYRAERVFPDWKKVKVKDMLTFYDEAVSNKPKPISK